MNINVLKPGMSLTLGTALAVTMGMTSGPFCMASSFSTSPISTQQAQLRPQKTRTPQV